MWYIQQLALNHWNNTFSYVNDHYQTAKDHLSELNHKHPKLQFRLIYETQD